MMTGNRRAGRETPSGSDLYLELPQANGIAESLSFSIPFQLHA
jgi:hypothetical protein